MDRSPNFSGLAMRIFKAARSAVWVCGLATLLSAAAIADPQGNFWPRGKHAAVSLSFDDGLPSQLDHAVPLLDELGFKATFYVNPNYSPDWVENKPRWRQLGLAGHEIGNHTDRHPCSCHQSYRSDKGYCLEKMGMEDIVRNIENGEAAIRELLPSPDTKPPRTFAYPCNKDHVGAGANRQSYVPEIARRYTAGRAGMGAANDPYAVDTAYLYSFAADGLTAEPVVRHIEDAVAKGKWVIITFHGIGGEWSQIDIAEFEKILRRLAEIRKPLWVAPVVEIAEYVNSRRTE